MRAESPRPGNHRTNPRSFPVATFQKRVLLSSVQRGRHNHNSSSRRHYPHFFACFASQYPSTDPRHTRVAQRPSRKSCFGASVIPGPGHGHMQVNNAPLFGHLHGLNQRISPLFEMLCRQCHRFFRREQLSFPFPTPTPGVSHTPSHSCRTQTVAFCPEPPLAHLSVTRGGGLPRSLSAVQIIVIDLEATNMQPFGSRTPFPTLSTASDGCRSLHPTLLFSRVVGMSQSKPHAPVRALLGRVFINGLPTPGTESRSIVCAVAFLTAPHSYCRVLRTALVSAQKATIYQATSWTSSIYLRHQWVCCDYKISA
jgi:hypothetical protein